MYEPAAVANGHLWAMQRVGRSSIEVFVDLGPGGAGGTRWLASCDIVATWL